MKTMTRKRGGGALIQSEYEARRAREYLYRRCCSAAVADARIVCATERTRRGVVVTRYLILPEQTADSESCWQRTCSRCGRIVPAPYMVGVDPAAKVEKGVCHDCAIEPNATANLAYGPSPMRTVLARLEALEARLRW